MGEKGVEAIAPEAGVSGSGTSGGQNFDEQAFGDLGAAQLQADVDLMAEAPIGSFHLGPEAVAKILPGTDAGGATRTGSGSGISSGGTDAGGSSGTDGTSDIPPGSTA